ncbi:MAG: TPM domain-containing protein [Allosphingosinicella sp.]
MRIALLILATPALLCACGPASQPRAADTEHGADQVVAAPASNAAFPVLTGRVVDLSEVLTPDQEASLTGELASLESRTSDQLVIVTIPSLDGRPIEDFSRDLGNHWGVGQDDKDNGVMIVVAPAERKVRILVGYGLEAILTNARAAEIIERDILPQFRAGRTYEGIEAGARSIIATLVAHERQPRQGRS